jgi:hypothetical protein
LENPQENWSLWGVMALVMARIVWSSMGVMLSMSKNTNRSTDLQARMMDEMSATRKSFERRDDEWSKTTKRIMDIQESSINRIDVTTQATLKNTQVIEQSGHNVDKRLTTIERYMVRMHKILEEKKVIP